MFELFDLPPERSPEILERLHTIWAESVRATHDFLKAKDFIDLSDILRRAYFPDADLIVAKDESGTLVGFMGMSETMIDALFLHPDVFRLGLGRRFINVAQERVGDQALRVDVNEQNPGSTAFYLQSGFEVIGRSDLDDQGRPYPLLHLERKC
ncbi:GNAT family N-acetyltransferase [Woodsholea maritima]|uniref:GNAT family N-acetyltransferase n=1 Tax=Woodsholea maritima TaxID=240237 RepID=UPI0003677A0A|nr:GNAT family N-acetyltransferase [Woodsholea maritima]